MYPDPSTPIVCLLDLSHIKSIMNILYLSTIQHQLLMQWMPLHVYFICYELSSLNHILANIVNTWGRITHNQSQLQ